MKRLLLPLLVLVLVMATSSMVLEGCGGGTSSSDRALFDKVMEAWMHKDGAVAKEVFASDANIYWNWPASSTGGPSMATGIDQITTLVSSGLMGIPSSIRDHVFTYVASDEDLKKLGPEYKGARFIIGPVRNGPDLYLLALEVRDGKVLNNYVEALYRDED